MKKLLLFICLALPSLLMSQQRIYLSGKDASTAVDWEFKISAGANRGIWSTIPVPSNWEFHGFGNYTHGEDFSKGRAANEVGYYRRDFSINKDAKHCYRLTFQGVLSDAYVKINGQSAGEYHQGGYMEFHYDISDLLKNGTNLIEVEVHKKSSNESISRSEQNADYWAMGGIYRPVFIDILPKSHIHRIAVNAEMDGLLEMDVFLNNAPKGSQISASLYNQNMELHASTDAIKATSEKTRLKHQFSGINPWNHEQPILYTLKVFLIHKKDTLHTHTEKIGFRTFEVRDHDGFYLNGTRILLKGACLHSWNPATGRALSCEDIETNFHLMKEMNFNTVRPCHYPPDEYLFDLCDSLGLLAMDELTGWHHPLPKKEGARLVKEMIVRDVNHPSIILWGNGNHGSHNPELDEDFFYWDIQKRRPLRNAAKKEDVFAGYHPDFDIVDTRYYPNWEQITHRLHEGGHIVLPNEALHALYDGGGAANMKDYWQEFKTSKYGGGLMIWAFLDEGAIRWDWANKIDLFGNMYPDGLIGPHREKEGSFYALKEIWSPIQIPDIKIEASFNGNIPLQNDYYFTNTSDCKFEWELINFTKVNDTEAGYRVQESGSALAPIIPENTSGELSLNLPATWKNYDALKLYVYSPQGLLLDSWTWPFSTSKELNSEFNAQYSKEIIQDQDNPYRFIIENCIYEFNAHNGQLESIFVNETKLPISSFPVLISDPQTKEQNSSSLKVSIEKRDKNYIITSKGNKGFDSFSWTIQPSGSIQLDYAYTLSEGSYNYSGIAMPIQASQVRSKKWLGEGPYRIWKNRTEGGELNVWESKKTVNIPGEVWNLPEFEGFFAPWYWASIQLTNNLKFVVADIANNSTLGILNPVNGHDPKQAKWVYPEKEGIFFFHHISPVGSKWKKPEEFGPSAQPAYVNQQCKGSVVFNFSWNRDKVIFKEKKIEIE